MNLADLISGKLNPSRSTVARSVASVAEVEQRVATLTTHTTPTFQPSVASVASFRLEKKISEEEVLDEDGIIARGKERLGVLARETGHSLDDLLDWYQNDLADIGANDEEEVRAAVRDYLNQHWLYRNHSLSVDISVVFPY